MAILETKADWDNNNSTSGTVISIHSPIIKCAEGEQFYTNYSISLKTSNPCFTRSFSCVKRRYSEFIFLRNLLVSHHPTMEPPELPPRKYFHRFDQSFINERIEGLASFLNRVIESPVYLSNKAVHLFLQSSTSMAKIVEEVSGDEQPTPRLVLPSSYDSRCESPLNFLRPETILCDNQPADEDLKGDLSEDIEIAEEAMAESVISPQLNSSEPIPILQPYLRPMSPESAASSGSPRWSAGSSNDSPSSASRRVSFCEKVKVAVVRDKLWDFGVRPIRNSN